MATPARIRVNTAFPFPALVSGQGPVTVGKSQGIWTIGFGTSVPLVWTAPQTFNGGITVTGGVGATLVNAANDAAAAAAGVAIGGLYHTTGTVKIRLA